MTTSLLGPLTRNGQRWVSKDGRWQFGRLDYDGWWHVWDDAVDDFALYERFETLRDAKAHVESILLAERNASTPPGR